MKKLLLTPLFVLLALSCFSQSAMEETMYKSGKIYTFLVVALLVLCAMVGYLVRLDLRLTKMEKDKAAKK